MQAAADATQHPNSGAWAMVPSERGGMEAEVHKRPSGFDLEKMYKVWYKDYAHKPTQDEFQQYD